MLGFFPTPYPDELLYSILARYYIWSSDTSPKSALKDLFGKTSVIATFDFPSHIESLVNNLPFGTKHSVENFIQQNTLFPYYLPFLPPERSKIVFESMRKHYSGDIHTRTGIMASSIPQIKFFRFCQICLQENIKDFGEPYWHRIHQITGVLVCPKHQTLLQNSTVKISGENRHEFYPADIENCIIKPHIVDYDGVMLRRFIQLAEDTNEILNLMLTSQTGEWFRRRYFSLLLEKGLANVGGRIYQKEFTSEFIHFYGQNFLRNVHSQVDVGKESNWL
jgi:TniQ/Tn7-like transposition protein D